MRKVRERERPEPAQSLCVLFSICIFAAKFVNCLLRVIGVALKHCKAREAHTSKAVDYFCDDGDEGGLMLTLAL